MTKHKPRRLLIEALITTTFLSLGCRTAPATADAQCGGFVVPGARVLTTSDMQASDKEAFLDRSPGGTPGCVVVDLNGDGIDDATLIGQDPRTKAVVFVAALGRSDGSFTTVTREPLGNSMNGLFLLRYPGREVSTTDAIDGAETVELSGGAVEVIFVEKAAVVYYWDPVAGELRSAQTAD